KTELVDRNSISGHREADSGDPEAKNQQQLAHFAVALLSSAPLPNFVHPLRHRLTRSSGAKGTGQLVGSSTAFRFQVPERACDHPCRAFKSATLVGIPVT